MAVSKQSAAAKTAAKPAVADALTPATEPAASGALVEPEILERIDTTHPAVDDEPRKGARRDSNRIDFNDPTLTPEEAVEDNLKN